MSQPGILVDAGSLCLYIVQVKVAQLLVRTGLPGIRLAPIEKCRQRQYEQRSGPRAGSEAIRKVYAAFTTFFGYLKSGP
jgi:hypothetical protein